MSSYWTQERKKVERAIRELVKLSQQARAAHNGLVANAYELAICILRRQFPSNTTDVEHKVLERIVEHSADIADILRQHAANLSGFLGKCSTSREEVERMEARVDHLHGLASELAALTPSALDEKCPCTHNVRVGEGGSICTEHGER